MISDLLLFFCFPSAVFKDFLSSVITSACFHHSNWQTLLLDTGYTGFLGGNEFLKGFKGGFFLSVVKHSGVQGLKCTGA